VLLGILSTSLDFSPTGWLPVLEEFAPKGTASLNLQAFEAGRTWSAQHGGAEDPDDTAAHRPAHTRAQSAPRENTPIAFEINLSWCKGCDICVKICPERCLS
jgi:indolepyruvate ferredoxin oxidoreductase beta subunit